MSIQLGDILRVAVTFRYANTWDQVNVWNIRFSGFGTAATDIDKMDAFARAADAWYTQLAASIPDVITGANVDGQNVTRNELLPLRTFAFAGTAAADGTPLQATPMLQWHSDTPRHGSRIYLPTLTETVQDDGVLTAGVMSVLADMAADVLVGFVDAVTGAEMDRVAYDRATTIARALTAAVVPTVLRTQRRRRQGVGS